jgi:hypothetical protein
MSDTSTPCGQPTRGNPFAGRAAYGRLLPSSPWTPHAKRLLSLSQSVRDRPHRSRGNAQSIRCACQPSPGSLCLIRQSSITVTQLRKVNSNFCRLFKTTREMLCKWVFWSLCKVISGMSSRPGGGFHTAFQRLKSLSAQVSQLSENMIKQKIHLISIFVW